MMFSPLHNNTVSHAAKRRDSGPLLTLSNETINYSGKT